jgi:PD-(D/E)XK nuclease superfamily
MALLIDAGTSSRGWSRIGTFFRCPQLFAYKQRLCQMAPEEGGIPSMGPSADALVKGSLGHTLLAHQHAIWGARMNPDGVLVDTKTYYNESAFMQPEEAAAAWCAKHGGYEHLDHMIEVFRRYLAKYPESPGTVIAVEAPFTAVLGNKDGAWGLWVATEKEGGEWRATDGAAIEVTPLDMPGHPEHGTAITITRRVDMITQDRAGRYFIWDHKHQASVNPNTSAPAYAIDGGFAAFRVMGKQLYGSQFGGVLLNLVQSISPFRVAQVPVPSTPHRDAQFAKQIWTAEHLIAQLDMSTDLWEWPKAQNELSCYGRYGPCDGLSLCSMGRLGVAS